MKILFVVALMFFISGAEMTPCISRLQLCGENKPCPSGFDCAVPPGRTNIKRCFPRTSEVERTCPSGWKRFGDSCYLFAYTVFVPFLQAVNYCQTQGGNILQAETPQENSFIKSELQSSGEQGWFWLGLTDIDGDGVRTWHLSGATPTYTDWGSEDYGTECSSYESFDNYRWARDGCGWNQVPICEKACCK